MAELERSGTALQDEGAYDTAPPPPPPPPKGGAAPATFAPAASSSQKYVAPVAAPWVPSYVSFLDFQKPFHRIVLMVGFAVFAGAGLILAGWAYGKAGEDSRFNRTAQMTTGKLIGKAKRNDIYRRRRADIEAYDVKYAFEAEGKKYEGEHEQMRADDIPGDPRDSFDGQNIEVDVYYDPNNPSNNRLEQANTTFDWILVAVGAVIVPVGLFGGWRVWRYDRYARSIGS
jgi:hypothetical protein